MNHVGDSPLLDGIIEHAQAEAKTILDDCEQDILRIHEEYQRKIREARETEHRVLEQQLHDIERREETQLRNLQRKKALWRTDRFKADTLASVSQMISEMVGTKAYEDVLVGWIAEAVIGLNRDEALVACSFKEHISEKMLEEAIRLVQKTTGKTVKLTLSDTPLSSQGVMVSSLDGKVVYDNRVVTRIERYGRNMNDVLEGDACTIGS